MPFVGQHIDPGEIAAGAGETGDETEPGRVFADQKNDGDGRGGRFGRECPPYPLTDPCQVDIIQSGPGWPGDRMQFDRLKRREFITPPAAGHQTG
jgi:hypothetical protein